MGGVIVTSSPKSKASETNRDSSAQPASSNTARPSPAKRKTRWWTYVLLALCLVLAWPLLQYNLAYWRKQSALTALEGGDFQAAITVLEAEQQRAPNLENAYWLAVAHRRAGHFTVFLQQLEKLKELGYPVEELQRQHLLMRFQSGEVGPQIEQLADQLIEAADKQPSSRVELYIDEFYEARARGYEANFRIFDAVVTVDHWVDARPDSIPARMLRADLREREMNLQAAEREYREVLARAPANLEARLQRGRLLLLNLMVPDATEEFRICVEQAPQEPRGQIGLAECEYRSGKEISSARQRLETVLRQELPAKQRAAALNLLGTIARHQKDREIALKCLTEAVELDPPLDPAPYSVISALYASLNNKEEAARYLKLSQEKLWRYAKLYDLANKITQAPENAQLRFEQGTIYQELAQPDQAATWWNMAVRLDPHLLGAHEALANYYKKKGDNDRSAHHQHMAEQSAEATFNSLWMDLLDGNAKSVREGLPKLESYPSLREPVELLKASLKVHEHEDLEQSAQELGRLTNNTKLRMRALTMLGEALYYMGHLMSAERAYQEVLTVSPQNVVAHRGLQSIYFDLGAYDQMELHALQVAKIDQTDYRPHRHMGFLRREAETWEAALADYQESLRRSPHQPTREEVLLEMADCYVHLLKYPEALERLKEARPSAQKSFLEAQCKFATKKVPEAKKLLDESLKTSPDHAPSLLLRSDIALVDGDPKAAREFLERAIKSAPHDNSAHQKLSAVLLRLGEKELAKEEGELAKTLLDLNLRFSELSNQASQKPKDLALRKELAALAEQLGREEEAKRWKRVVESLEEDQAEEARRAKAKESSDKNPVIPSVTKPRAIAPLAKPIQGEVPSLGPKACGEEPAAAEEPKKEEKPAEVFSGPQKGEKLPGFTLKISGEAEKELDVVKEAAGKPTLIVFVHTVTRPSVGMARVLGDYAATRKKDGLHVGVAFLTADATETQTWIKRAVAALPKNVPLGIAEGGQEGPGAYGLNRNVAMTILVSKEGKVTANFALVQPSLQADGPKILKEIVDVLGGGKVPSIEELMKQPEMRRERGKEPPKGEEKKGEGEKGR